MSVLFVLSSLWFITGNVAFNSVYFQFNCKNKMTIEIECLCWNWESISCIWFGLGSLVGTIWHFDSGLASGFSSSSSSVSRLTSVFSSATSPASSRNALWRSWHSSSSTRPFQGSLSSVTSGTVWGCWTKTAYVGCHRSLSMFAAMSQKMPWSLLTKVSRAWICTEMVKHK